MAADTQTLKYILEFDAKGAEQFQRILKKIKEDMKDYDMTTRKMSQSAGALGIDMGKLAARAAITIPIWLAMRTAFMDTLRTIGDGAKYIGEFDAALRRMQAVSSNVLDMSGFMKQLGQDVKDLSTQTGRSITEISGIYYAFAETGMKATEAQAGMNVALKLAVGTFADTKETARIMVDLYNMFGASMGNAMTPMEKMQQIAGTFVTLWKENSGNLSEYINALKMLTPIAKNYNLSMQETLTTAIVLNNYMQRGTMGGTQMARALNEITKNAAKFEEIGIKVRGRTDGMQVFMDVLMKLNSIDAGQRGSLINQLFGERSQRGVSALAATDALEKLLTQLEKVKNLSLDDAIKALNDSFELQNKSLENQVKVFDQLRKQAGAAFLIGVMGARDYEDALKKAGDALYNLNQLMINGVIPTLQGLGATINFLVNNPIGQLITSLGIAATLLKTVVPLLGLLKANPVVAVLTTTAAVATGVNAAKAAENAKKEEYLQKVREGARAGKPLEEFLPGMTREEALYGSITAPGSNDERFRGVKKITHGATPNEIRKAYFGETSQMEADKAEKDKLDLEKVVAQEKEASLKTQLAYASILKSYGYDDLQIEIEKYRIMKQAGEGEDQIKLADQARKIMETQIEMANKYADILKTNLNEAFLNIFEGKAGAGGIGKAINDSLVQGFRQTASEGLTNMLMATGLGDLFGSAMMGFKGVFTGLSGLITGAFHTGGRETYNWIIRAFADGRGIAAGGSAATAIMSTGAMMGGVGGFSTMGAGSLIGTIAGSVMGAPLASWGGQGGTTIMTSAGPGVRRGTPGYQATLGQVGGSALLGYSAYQSASQSGAGTGTSIAAGLLTGIGGLGAMIGMGGMGASLAAGGAAAAAGGLGTMAGIGTAFAAMGPIGWIGLGLLAGGMLLTMFGGGGKKTQTQTSIQTQTSEKMVATKIDVTNKKLELINRNLVALRNTMETYIMPQSTYFSTARNLEDEFSLSARRG